MATNICSSSGGGEAGSGVDQDPSTPTGYTGKLEMAEKKGSCLDSGNTEITPHFVLDRDSHNLIYVSCATPVRPPLPAVSPPAARRWQ